MLPECNNKTYRNTRNLMIESTWNQPSFPYAVGKEKWNKNQFHEQQGQLHVNSWKQKLLPIIIQTVTMSKYYHFTMKTL